MVGVDSIKKEVEKLKRDNRNLVKRVSYLEKGLGVSNQRNDDSEIKEEKIKKSNGKNEGSGFLGVILILAGLFIWFIDFTRYDYIFGFICVILGIIYIIHIRNKGKKRKNKIKSERKVVRVKDKVKEEKIRKQSFESKIGLKWLSRIGIIALVIGIGYFIKYAIDNNWINHLTRISLGVFLGIVLVIIGEIISKKKNYEIWGKSLVGGGLAISYFVIYAAYFFKEYRDAIGISLIIDIFLLSIVVLIAVILSLKDNSKIIAGEAFFLGYLTSLFSTEFQIITLVYGLLLSIGLIFVVSYKKWNIFGICGVILTYLLYKIVNNGMDNTFFVSLLFLIIYFISYNIQSLIIIRNKIKNLHIENIIFSLINSALFFLLSFELIRKFYPEFDGLLCLVLSLFYISTFIYMRKYDRDISLVYLYLGILYFTLFILLGLNNEWITIFWALEGLLLMILFFKTKLNALKYSSYVVCAFAAIKTLVYDSIYLNKFSIANILGSTRLISFLVTIISLYVILFLVQKDKKTLKDDELIIKIISWIASILLVLIIILESLDNKYLITILLSILSLIFLYISKGANSDFSYQSIFISFLLAFKLLVYDSFINSYSAFYESRLFLYIVSIITFYSFMIIWKKKYNKEEIIFNIYSYIGASFLVLLIILENIDYKYLITILLSILSLIFLIISKKPKSNFSFQSLAISIILAFKLIFFDIFINNPNLPFYEKRLFVFIISIISFYICGVVWNIKFKKEKIISDVYLWAATTFFALLILLEFKEFWISIGWAVLALTVLLLGFIWKKEQLRLQGLVLFALTIFKVFLYDTRNLGTLARTISFIVLGVILLVASFFYAKYKDKLKEII